MRRPRPLRHVGNFSQLTFAARGFSIVELLVVVAIIAIFIGLMMPTLLRAREKSRQLSCAANLRGLAMAVQMYVNANRNVFPADASYDESFSDVIGNPTPTQGRYYDWVFWLSFAGAPEYNVSALSKCALAQYLGRPTNLKLFNCPSDPWTRHIDASGRHPSEIYYFSYVINACIASGPTSPTPYCSKITRIRNPSQKILFVEEDEKTITDGAWRPDSYPSHLLSARHDIRGQKGRQARGNAAFVDGHVAIISQADASDPRFFRPE